MKKISLKIFRKSFSLSKSKEDSEFEVVKQPALASNFRKEESLFGSCYGKEMAGCDLHHEDEMGKNRPKSESLMGTLKRLLSAKQRPRARVAWHWGAQWIRIGSRCRRRPWCSRICSR